MKEYWLYSLRVFVILGHLNLEKEGNLVKGTFKFI